MLSRNEVLRKLVGERLPYVFIDSIVLSDPTSLRSEDTLTNDVDRPEFIRNRYGNNNLAPGSRNLDTEDKQAVTATITVSMNDLLHKPHWYNPSILGSLTIKVLCATSSAAFNYIKSPQATSLAGVPKRLKKHIKERTLTFPTNKTLKDYAVRQLSEHNDTLCTIKLKRQFRLESDFIGFAVFPAFEPLGLQGRRTSQKALSNGKTNFTSYTFYSKDGSVWKGPVHRHPTIGFMEGARHTERPHGELTVVEHENVVRDHRIFGQMRQLQQQVSLSSPEEPKRVYSNVFLSGDSSGIVRGMFAFDLEGFLRQNSEFNRLINVRNRKKIMSLARISDLRVYRDKIYDFEGGYSRESGAMKARAPERTVIVSSSDSGLPAGSVARAQNKIDEDGDEIKEKTVGYLEQLNIAGLGTKKAFSFVDSEASELAGGTYRYGVEIEITDPTKKFLNMRLNTLRRARNIIMSYYEEAKSPSNFNSATGQFTYEYLSYLKKIYNLDVKIKGNANKPTSLPWRTSPMLYFNALEELLGRKISRRQKKSLQKSLYPSTGGLEGVENYIDLLDSLIASLSGLEVSQSENTSRSSGGRNKPQRDDKLRSSREFSERPWKASKHTNSKVYLNYMRGALAKSPGRLPRVNRNSLLNRFSVEANKFFPEVVGKNEREVTNEDLKGFRKVYNSSLTPTVVETKEEEIVLSRTLEGSFERAHGALKADEKSAEYSEGTVDDTLAGMGVRIENRRLKRKKNRKFSNSTEYFGENRNFQTKTGDDKREEAYATEDPKQNELKDKLLTKEKQQEEETPVSRKDSLPRRYLKIRRRMRQAKQQQGETIDTKAEESEVKEEEVLEKTIASVKYITGFDSAMEPIYSKTVPVSAEQVVFVIEKEETTDGSSPDNQQISDSLGIIETSGETIPQEKLKEDDPCDDTIIEQETIPDKPVEQEDPCGDGQKYNPVTGECEDIEITVPLPQDEKDPPVQDVEPEPQTVVTEEVIPPKPTEAPLAPQPTVSVDATPVAVSEQQQGYFVRRRILPESNSTETVQNDSQATTLTRGGSSGY